MRCAALYVKQFNIAFLLQVYTMQMTADQQLSELAEGQPECVSQENKRSLASHV